ncbi:Transmembrane domain-containing protein [Orpheovirus IHUMI-LCC2]|uniref:Transmembrane domain-containing protein n=1 Tax=Orpheovirus IHUMI-LCC2 TaxID=2023057 RepID=A0A2I2L489_9VIRU|nr:Transmembrane domain-containing protein [Orpheovirus IHUMI-LCC2]SNW62362.1 Transmembrane domain-containing protein [Orpheovirus IHUMI-LCC2]
MLSRSLRTVGNRLLITNVFHNKSPHLLFNTLKLNTNGYRKQLYNTNLVKDNNIKLINMSLKDENNSNSVNLYVNMFNKNLYNTRYKILVKIEEDIKNCEELRKECENKMHNMKLSEKDVDTIERTKMELEKHNKNKSDLENSLKYYNDKYCNEFLEFEEKNGYNHGNIDLLRSCSVGVVLAVGAAIQASDVSRVFMLPHNLMWLYLAIPGACIGYTLKREYTLSSRWNKFINMPYSENL